VDVDADSKLIVSWLVGGRDAENAAEFMGDLQWRLANRVQLTTDGHGACLSAVQEAFGIDVDYAQLVKIYGNAPKGAKAQPNARASRRTALLATPSNRT